MRIIAGKYRGRILKSPPTLEVRPTSDRLRETLFNVIAEEVEGLRFLDLCAGSGAVGIEALSRGAGHSTFVDRSRKMCRLIEANLDLCRVPEEQREIINAEANEFLRRVASRSGGAEKGSGSSLSKVELRTKELPWNLVFFDPPYATDYLGVLNQLAKFRSDETSEFLLIVEHQSKTSLPEKIEELHRRRVLKQGDSTLSFYRFS